MIQINFPSFDFKFELKNGNRYIFDISRKKYVILSPEEWVRQHILHYLIFELKYPLGLCSVEKEIKVNQLKKRYDIVVYNKNKQPWMLIECKEPNVVISKLTLNQLLIYHQVLQCPYWVLTNGSHTYCASVKNNSIEWLHHLPAYQP